MSYLALGASVLVGTERESFADDATTSPAASESMFPKGTWALEFTGGYQMSFEAGEETIMPVSAGIDYYFDERHSARFELAGYCMDTKTSNNHGDHPAAIGLNLGLRYQFLESGPWTLFVEGLAGLFQANYDFPEGGTHFNFNQQAGIGATFRVDEHVHLIGGARYLHISNAGIHGEDENPSFNGVGGYVGVLFTF